MLDAGSERLDCSARFRPIAASQEEEVTEAEPQSEPPSHPVRDLFLEPTLIEASPLTSDREEIPAADGKDLIDQNPLQFDDRVRRSCQSLCAMLEIQGNVRVEKQSRERIPNGTSNFDLRSRQRRWIHGRRRVSRPA